jgi:hypothetical protein
MKISLAGVRALLWRSALFAGLWWALADGRPDGGGYYFHAQVPRA